MSDRVERLRRLINPRSIVFVGGGTVEPAIVYVRRLGFSGNLYALNPRRDEIAGVQCFRKAADLPEIPDAAFVLVPGESAVGAVHDLSRAGVGAAVVCSSGFSECGREDLQSELTEAAADMPFLGPNSPGFANFLDGTAAMLDNMGVTPCERGVAVISNGGAYLNDLACGDRSLPIAMIVGLGNQATVSVADMVDAVLDDPRVNAINLYFEGLNDISRLSHVAEKALVKNIPVVAVKVGQTTAGARATATHTASMTSDSVVVSALFRRLGFIEVENNSEAMETLKMLSISKRVKGRRIGFITSSGSYAAMGADLAEKAGLELPALKPQHREMLQPLMESFIIPNNPLDLATAHFWPNEDQRRLFDAFLSIGFDVALQCMTFPAENTWEDESWYRSARTFGEAAKAAGLPAVLVSSIHEGLPKKARDMLIELGVAPLQGFHDGIRAVMHAANYGEIIDQGVENIRLPEPADLSENSVSVDEAQAKELLRQAGVLTPKGIIWESGEVPDDIQYPVALKMCGRKILHKTEIGGVKLNIATPVQLRDARQCMLHSAQQRGMDIKRFLIEPMLKNGAGDLLVGVRQVPKMGMTLTIAFGGVATEVFHDSATLLLPATRSEIKAALRSLKMYPLLDGWRGRTKADTDAAIETIFAICAFAEARRDSLLELEINPLALFAEGQGTCALDAVMRFTEQE